LVKVLDARDVADGLRLASLRDERQWSQEQFGAKIGGETRQTVGEWESGKRPVPPKKRRRIARALGVTPAAIWQADPAQSDDTEQNVPRETILALHPRDYGAMIQQRRLAIGMSPEELAEAIGVDPRGDAITQIERGRSDGEQRRRRLPDFVVALRADEATLLTYVPSSAGKSLPKVGQMASADALYELIAESENVLRRMRELHVQMIRGDA
jgi:transcriptional regulator with XRE-family HTH domain